MEPATRHHPAPADALGRDRVVPARLVGHAARQAQQLGDLVDGVGEPGDAGGCRHRASAGGAVRSWCCSLSPKYQRIADQLRQAIRAGEHLPGERMPAETDLTERFNVSLPTVRQALSVLRAEGLIESRQGRGTFVKEVRKLQRRSRHRYGRARAAGQLLTSHLRHQNTGAGREPTPPHVAEVLSDGPEELIVRRRVLRDAETGRAEKIGASYLPVSIAAGTFLEEPRVVPKALFLCVEDLSGKGYAFARDRWKRACPAPRKTTCPTWCPGPPWCTSSTWPTPRTGGAGGVGVGVAGRADRHPGRVRDHAAGRHPDRAVGGLMDDVTLMRDHWWPRPGWRPGATCTRGT